MVERSGVEPKDAAQIAHIADGNLQQAFSIMNDVKDDNLPIFQKWMRACFTRNYTDFVTMSDEFHDLKREGQKGLFFFALTIASEILCLS